MSTPKPVATSPIAAVDAAPVKAIKEKKEKKEEKKEKENIDYTKPPVAVYEKEDVAGMLLEGATEEAMEEETDELLKQFRAVDIDQIDLTGLTALFKKEMVKYDACVVDANTLSKAYICFPTTKGYNTSSNALHKAKQFGIRVETIKAMINQNFKERIGGASNLLLDCLHRLESTFEGSGTGGVHAVLKEHRQALITQIKNDLDVNDPHVRRLLDLNNRRRLFNNIHLVKTLYETQHKLLPQWFVNEYGLLLKAKDGLVPSGAKSAEDQKQYSDALKQRADENIPKAKAKGKNPELKEAKEMTDESAKKNKKKKHKKKKKKEVVKKESSESSDSASATDSE